MFLSIVIPVYNTAAYLRKCLDSILVQDENDYEIILVDDGSTDGICPGICDEYKARYPHIVNLIHKENGGQGSARNVGIRLAGGDYICFLDSDDYLLQGSLSILKNALRKFSPDVIQFGYQIEKNGKIVDTICENLPVNQLLRMDEYPQFITMGPMVCTRIWKRTLFTEHNIWFPDRAWFEDLRTSLKLLTKAEGILNIRDVLYVYVQREGSTMHNTNTARYAEILDALRDLVTWFKDNQIFEKYYVYICRLAVFQTFVIAGPRIARQNPKDPLLKTFHAYLRDTFPGYMRVLLPDLWGLPRYYRIMIILMYTHNYRVIRWLFLHLRK